jgi:hypothetical protein
VALQLFSGLLGLFALGLIGVATVCLVHPLAHLGMGTRFRAFIGVALGVLMLLASYWLTMASEHRLQIH